MSWPRLAAFATTVSVVCATLSSPALAAPRAVSYAPPVDAPLREAFRPPSSDFTAGNRGIDYATEAGDAVRASADGEVVFAGRIGPAHHVTVLHADGLRTSYSFLQSTTVRRGDKVSQGDVVGIAAGPLHFGARAGDVYLDPNDLLAGGGIQVRLVPFEDPPTEAQERSWLAGMLGGLGGAVTGAFDAGVGALDWAASRLSDEARRLLHYAGVFFPPAALIDVANLIAIATAEWQEAQKDCIPPNQALPPPSKRRRIALLVGGINSSSEDLAGGGSVGAIDTEALGFRPEDVYGFSYQGGHIGERGYGPEDTRGDLNQAGAKLAALVRRLARENPGVPIVVMAHSQGGLVTRSALARDGVEAVSDVITLATPHHGSDTATALAHVGGVNPVGAAIAVADSVMDMGAGSVAAGQLSETSDFIRSLPDVPSSVNLTSIAARDDYVVPTPRSRVEGADNRIVVLGSATDHSVLPGHPAALREIALALAGLGQTCVDYWNFMRSRLEGHGLSLAIDAAAVAIGGSPGL